MSVSLYRSQVDRLTTELAQLEGKAANERDRAARERAGGLRASQSISSSTTATTARTKLREAQRHEERAVGHDRLAARYATQSASKQRALSDAQSRLAKAEVAERKKNSADAERRRKAEMQGLRAPYLEGPRGRSAPIVVENPGATTERPGEDQPDRDQGLDRRDPELRRLEPAQFSDDSLVDTTIEVAKAVALGSLSSVPVLGPVLREVIGVAWGDNRADRLQRFAVQLRNDVEVIQERLDLDFVRKDEFEALAEEALERVVLRRNERKIPEFAAAVANSATVERPDQRTRERYMDLLNDLRPVHLEILTRISTGRQGWTRPGDVITPGQAVNSKLAHVLDGVATDRLDLNDLVRHGLIHPLDDTSTLMRAADNISSLLTALGREFVTFLSIADTNRDVAGPAGES